MVAALEPIISIDNRIEKYRTPGGLSSIGADPGFPGEALNDALWCAQLFESTWVILTVLEVIRESETPCMG
jgi:hypothetical protein